MAASCQSGHEIRPPRAFGLKFGTRRSRRIKNTIIRDNLFFNITAFILCLVLISFEMSSPFITSLLFIAGDWLLPGKGFCRLAMQKAVLDSLDVMELSNYKEVEFLKFFFPLFQHRVCSQIRFPIDNFLQNGSSETLPQFGWSLQLQYFLIWFFRQEYSSFITCDRKSCSLQPCWFASRRQPKRSSTRSVKKYYASEQKKLATFFGRVSSSRNYI